MKSILSVLVTAILLAGFVYAATENEATTKAKDAATAWLALTDSGKYAESWDGAAALFKSSITKENWTKALQPTREQLGAVKSRKLKSANFMTELPGAPDGQYVVIQFDTVFANKAAAVETITPMLEKDGSWKVSGYYIK